MDARAVLYNDQVPMVRDGYLYAALIAAGLLIACNGQCAVRPASVLARGVLPVVFSRS